MKEHTKKYGFLWKLIFIILICFWKHSRHEISSPEYMQGVKKEGLGSWITNIFSTNAIALVAE